MIELLIIIKIITAAIVIMILYKIGFNDPFGFKEDNRIKVKLSIANLDHRQKLFNQMMDETRVDHLEFFIEHLKKLKKSNNSNRFKGENGEPLDEVIEKKEKELIELQERNFERKTERWNME